MMNELLTRTVLSLTAIFLLVFGVTAGVAAQSSSVPDELLETIRARCSSSQLALQQIEKRDAVSRINRGRAYDQMLRQLSAFNSRFAYNKINSPDLIQITTDLQNAVNDFRSSFDRYDTDIANALRVNCKEKPADYYQTIVKAREDRSDVGEQVAEIQRLMSRYRDAAVKYKETAR